MTWEFLDAILVCGRTRHTDPDLVPDILNYYTSLYVPEKSVKKAAPHISGSVVFAARHEGGAA